MLYPFPVRLHRFIIDADLAQTFATITDTSVLHQWQKVLRLKAGDHVMLCDGKGMESEATMETLEAKHAKLRLHGAHTMTAEPSQEVTLYCSVLKRENFEWVVQKCTELGVKSIVPVIAKRTVKTGLKMERLRTIAKEAAEQSGRGMIPQISVPVNFASALVEAKNTTNIFFQTQQEKTESYTLKAESCNIWIGPEGGWTEEEIALAKEHACITGSLGTLTLRAETAAVVAVYAAIHCT